jgi:hypothetical protein
MGCFIIISMRWIGFQQEDFKRRLNVCCVNRGERPARRAGHTLRALLDVCGNEGSAQGAAMAGKGCGQKVRRARICPGILTSATALSSSLADGAD